MAATIKNATFAPMDVMPLMQEAFEIAQKLPPEIQALIVKYWQGYADGYNTAYAAAQSTTAVS